MTVEYLFKPIWTIKESLAYNDVNAMLLYNQDQLDNNKPDNLLSSLPRRKQGIAARLSYAYDDRYLAEVNFGYNGSENFAKNNRFGFLHFRLFLE